MPVKAKSPKVKAEWVLCSQTGLWYHASSAANWAAWLEGGAATPPPRPHTEAGQLQSELVVGRGSCNPPPALARHAVLLSPALATHLALPQACLVSVTPEGQAPQLLTALATPSLPAPALLHCLPGSRAASHAPCPASLTLYTGPVHPAQQIIIQPDSETEADTSSPGWRAAVRAQLPGLTFLPPACTTTLTHYGAEFRLQLEVAGELEQRLQDLSIDSEASQPAVRVTSHTELVFPLPAPRHAPGPAPAGLDKERAALLASLRPALAGARSRPAAGVLLHGPPGTGKSLLAASLGAELGAEQITVAGPELLSKFHGETEGRLRAEWNKAVRGAPALLVIEDVDSLGGGGGGAEGGATELERRVVGCLASLLDSLALHPAPRLAVLAITASLDRVDPALRRPGRFDLEVELGIPGPEARAEILTSLVAAAAPAQASLPSPGLTNLARATHGFTGADLAAVVAGCTERPLTLEALQRARQAVRPSSMRAVAVEVPAVAWTDIGGMESLKLKLRQAVEWPHKHPEAFQRLGISPPRGLLMFGPPGCSKTMIARALATESGLNFLSIKGPELFSKWVGESERAVRELFRKARQVAPSIVFFDEIDAVGGVRGGGGGRVGDRVLAQLLTELDGVEGLVGVTVVAATNRPDMMDPALLRPGRLDRVVYVPLPDLATRRQILAVHTKQTPLEGVDLDLVAARTEGYSGAEVAAVCGEAAMAALEQSTEAAAVSHEHYQAALESVRPRISRDLFTVYEKFQSENRSKAV